MPETTKDLESKEEEVADVTQRDPNTLGTERESAESDEAPHQGKRTTGGYVPG